MLGFDLDPSATARQLAAWSQTCPAHGDDITQHEDEILRIFVDICSLFHREPDVNHRASGEEPSAESYLFSYLRMVETNAEGLPPAFVAALRSALSHYGVLELDGSSRSEGNIAVDLQIAPADGRARSPRFSIFSSGVCATPRLRDHPPAVPSGRYSIASSPSPMKSIPRSAISRAKYAIATSMSRCLSAPGIKSSRKQKTTSTISPRIPTQRIAVPGCTPSSSVLNCSRACLPPASHPPNPLYAAPCSRCSPGGTTAIVRSSTLVSLSAEGHPCFSAEYDDEGKRIHVFATYSEYKGLPAAAQAMFALIGDVPADHDIVIDFHVCHSAKLGDPDATQREIQAMLNQVAFPRPIRRIVVSAAGAEPGPSRERPATLHLPAQWQ